MPPRQASTHVPDAPPGAAIAPGQRHIAAYAASALASRGRLVGEPESLTRSPFQRDRDRIIHSTAFRRLTHKTQVFVYHEGDHFRTRLTHSLEVAQIARTVARLLQLDEDLAEALALAHDLGHPPFGHAGERALQAVTQDFGGFDHNARNLKVVTALEKKYADFDGLNLTWETLEGLVKHNGPLIGPRAAPATVPLAPELAAYAKHQDLALDRFASAEAQVAALADDIAYNNHDLDDGLRAGLFGIDMLMQVELTARYASEVLVTHGDLAGPRLIYEVNRRLITGMVNDVVAETGRRLAAVKPRSPDDIRNLDGPIAAFSEGLDRELGELREFLFAHVYRHDRVMRRMREAERVVTELFTRYRTDPVALPEHWRRSAEQLPATDRARLIVDFVAGMTDRYAIAEYLRLFDQVPDFG